MAAINFPDSPSNGDTHTVGGVTYTYNSAETKWKTTINSNAFLPLSGGTVSGNLSVSGDVTVDTNTLYVDSTNNRVGINTTSPGDLLHIMESSASAAASSGASVAQFERAGNVGITISTADTGESTVFFGDTASSTVGRVQYDHSDNSLGFWANSLERARITSNGDLRFNSGFGSVATAYGVRAWINYDSTVAPVNIRGSGRISSVGDGGVGRQTINFATAMPDANYAVVAGPGDQRTGNNSFTYNPAFYDFATGSFKVATFSDSTWDDYQNMSLAVIR